MIDTLDLIETYAAAGYAWLARALPLLQAEYWLIGTLLLAGTVWALVRELPAATEGRGDPLWGVLKYWFCALLGVFFLYVTVAAPLNDFAPRLDAKAAADLGGMGRLTLPSYATELLARDAVTVALSMSNPSKQKLVQVPAAQLAANKVLDSALANSDPQVAANHRIWQQVLAPAYLEASSPALRDALVRAGLLDVFLNPFSDLHNGSPASERARAVRAILDSTGPTPLIEMLPALQPLINERLGGASSWSAQNGRVAVTMLSAPTASAANAPPGPTPEIVSRPEAMDAYTLGLGTLQSVYKDGNRQPPPDFGSLGELYTALGRANDVVAAANVLRDPLATMWFGATCQRKPELCIRALVDTQAKQAAEAAQGETNTVARYLANLVGFVGTLAGRLVATVMEAIISSIMPASIGYAKAIVVLLSPVALLLMLWPGRFLLAVYLTVGAHVFIALWTVFYVIWDRFTGNQLVAVAGFRAVSQPWATNELLASNIAQLLIVGGYFGLTALAFAIAMDAASALKHAAGGAARAGWGSVSAAADRASAAANQWGAGRVRGRVATAVTVARAASSGTRRPVSIGGNAAPLAATAGSRSGGGSHAPAAAVPRPVQLGAGASAAPAPSPRVTA